MKTSNKTIFSFLIFAWLCFIATLLISHRFADYDNVPAMRKVTVKAKLLNEFSVVKIEQAAVLKIIQGDSSIIRYNEITGDGIRPPKIDAIKDLEVKNDTLFIKNLHQAPNGGFTLEVLNLKHLIVNNTSEINLSKISQDSLLISSTNSNIIISNSSEISFLHLKSGEKFDLKFQDAKKLNLNLRDNNCSVIGEINRISGTIGNYTTLEVPRKTENIDVKTSENGKLEFVLE